jgi:glycosyltransferase involved in cell wall biosynthesis
MEVELLTVSESKESIASEAGYRERRFAWDYLQVPILSGLRASSRLSCALRKEALFGDVIHNHGVWLMPNVYAGWEAVRARKPLVFGPRGMLSPAALSFSRLKKQAFWHLLQRSVVARATCFHATSEDEYREIRSLGLAQPVAVIPNGIDIEDLPEDRQNDTKERIVLSLGRIHPKKGLDRLVRSWAVVEAAHPDWRLRIVGSSEGGYAEELQALAAQLGLRRVAIEGPLYGSEKKHAYRTANLFVLPTLSENFALTVAEALAAGVPVISTKGAPWSGLAREGCGWWIDHGVEMLAAALGEAMAMPVNRLTAMGAKGRLWMARDFSWERVACDMTDLYRWLVASTTQPDFVRWP